MKTKSLSETFAAQLAALRGATSQRELGRRLGLDASAICRSEAGGSLPRVGQLVARARHFGVGLEAMLGLVPLRRAHGGKASRR